VKNGAVSKGGREEKGGFDLIQFRFDLVWCCRLLLSDMATATAASNGWHSRFA